MCVYSFDIFNIGFTTLSYFELPSNTFDIYSIWLYGLKPLSLIIPKKFLIENQLNMKKVMSKDV